MWPKSSSPRWSFPSDWMRPSPPISSPRPRCTTLSPSTTRARATMCGPPRSYCPTGASSITNRSGCSWRGSTGASCAGASPSSASARRPARHGCTSRCCRMPAAEASGMPWPSGSSSSRSTRVARRRSSTRRRGAPAALGWWHPRVSATCPPTPLRRGCCSRAATGSSRSSAAAACPCRSSLAGWMPCSTRRALRRARTTACTSGAGTRLPSGGRTSASCSRGGEPAHARRQRGPRVRAVRLRGRLAQRPRVESPRDGGRPRLLGPPASTPIARRTRRAAQARPAAAWRRKTAIDVDLARDDRGWVDYRPCDERGGRLRNARRCGSAAT